MAATLVDMHFHLDFCEDPGAHAQAARAAGIGMLAVSCEPAGHERVAALAAQTPSGGVPLVPALGLHPWRVACGELGPGALDNFERLAPDAPAFGELGLDFADRHTPPDSHAAQLGAFERACTAADASARAAGIRKPVSIHAIRAADETLDVLERTGCMESCACVFHWFSGSTPQLWRAIHAGCWFSVNERFMGTGRGREYAKLVPADKLLLETDLPASPGAPLSAAEHRASLERCCELLNAALGRDMRTQTAENAQALLTSDGIA